MFVLALFMINIGWAQNEKAKPEKKKKDKPVRKMFSSELLIDEQTSYIALKNTLGTEIQHRFGLIKNNGISDLFGIYAPSANTRIGFNYSILDNLMVGYGITRKNMYSDFQVKWNILRQTRKNTIPLDLTIYANMAIDSRNKDVFATTTADSVYQFANRLSYFTQLIVSRKFTDWFSFAASGCFTHYNSVPADTANVRGMDHDKFGFGLMARFRVSPQSSILIQYSMPVYINQISENDVVTIQSLPNFGIAFEVATGWHVFQVFITTSNGIIPQENYMYNTNDWTKGEFRIGFNITRLWDF